MQNKTKKSRGEANAPCGIVLYAKKSGITSFSSLWSIKHALCTNKVGHTGTLDSFAQGLLVVLSGNLTHIVPHITGYRKTYEAVVCFGSQTDTLDPCGTVVATGDAPTRGDVESSLASFRGALLQVPPVYSSVHVGGKRASSLARGGQEVTLDSRQIFVYENELVDFKAPYALLRITCSKGTYIRALARDIAASLGTVAHLIALRRTAVGPFRLEDAAGYSDLEEFTIDNAVKNKELLSSALGHHSDTPELIEDIRSRFLPFSPDLAMRCGFDADILKAQYERSYSNGRPLSSKMFSIMERGAEYDDEYRFPSEIAVFYENGDFGGMIKKSDGRLSYSFVAPRAQRQPLQVFSWQDLLDNRFPVEYLSKGSALSIGSFDAFHAGHKALLDGVMSQKRYARGIVTFTRSYKSLSPDYEGDVLSASQKRDLCSQEGLDFVVVIDFSAEFSKIDGKDFMRVLARKCSLRCLVEGSDFRCGYKGAFDMEGIRSLSSELGFDVECVDDVSVGGERISSSLIRSAIRRGDFDRVRSLLLRPFEYDCRGFSWRKTDDGLLAAPSGVQVLPPYAAYKVSVLKDDTTFVEGECTVADGAITVRSASPLGDGSEIEALRFI